MKILGTTHISYEIENLLNQAGKYLILVSPYFKLNQRLKVRLTDAFQCVEEVFILYRKGEINKKELEWLNSFAKIHLYGVSNLHAKIYSSEKSAIVTSMNLYEYSQVNNHEIGILFHTDDSEYPSLINEIRIMIESEYKTHDFSQIVEVNTDYSMRRLYNKIEYHYKVKIPYNYNQTQYEYLCNEAMKIVDFKKSEMYEDGTAILRSTNLGKIRFELLESKLKSLAV